eukprot:TRINITY_DN65985_c0_g1_i1.p1 TRINITY_DN65985_c0_g1~~TRINITY_DN65985_c0_g1_i1.p1  ORF type:complete len:277 (+),score=23.17 TRINITY_DN65985_c0_g1_i1:455-1285(+)
MYQNLQSTMSSKGVAILKETRYTPELSPRNESPGPAYNVSKERSGPSCGFGFAKQAHQILIKASPGPGDYVNPPVVGSEGVKHSFGGRTPLLNRSRDDSPGPAAHGGSEAIVQSQSAYKFGKAQKLLMPKSRSPGPVAYKTEYGNMFSLKSSSPGPLSREPRRVPFLGKFGPGPAVYDTPLKIGEGPKPTMKSRIELPLPKVPGPGSYNPNQKALYMTNPSYGLGKGSRSNWLASEATSPGPAVYDCPKSKVNGFFFGSTARMPDPKSQSPPCTLR